MLPVWEESAGVGSWHSGIVVLFGIWGATGFRVGPVLFFLYTADLVALVQGFGLSAHVFADDLQVYCHFLDGKEHFALQRFRDCSESASRWMPSNRLKLNPLKTELIWLAVEEILLFFERTLYYLVVLSYHSCECCS